MLKALMGEMPRILTPVIADYHVSRARCSKAAKRHRKAKEGKAQEESSGAPAASVDEMPAEAIRPDILDHLVLGLNEVIKTLELATKDLEMQLVALADSIEGVGPRFLPTEPTPKTSLTAQPSAPITHVLVPHLSVSPLALVDPVLQLCATYNTHVRQLRLLSKQAKNATETPELSEICLVSLGNEEAEVAALAGLRRVACFAVRKSHPEIGVLGELCKNITPPRHSITLPFPTRLRVIDGEKEKPAKRLPQVNVEYAPLHVKALHTTAPLDNNARKAVRLEEVRKKRVENKLKRRQAREALERKVRLDLGKARGKGRKARLAEKAEMAKAVGSVKAQSKSKQK